MSRIRSHLTYANVMVTVLAFIVLGGTALAATGGNFILGHANTAGQQTSLSASPAFTGKALQLTNTSTGAGATALGLNVGSGHPPFTTNSGTKVANLNADKLDGKDSTSWKVADVIGANGPLPIEGTYTSSGGKLLIMASGSGYRASTSSYFAGHIGMDVKVDGTTYAVPAVFTNEQDSHKAFVSDYVVVSGLPAGAHTVRLERKESASCHTGFEGVQNFCTTTDNGDYFHVGVVEIP
jgi:hypothetical protein